MTTRLGLALAATLALLAGCGGSDTAAEDEGTDAAPSSSTSPAKAEAKSRCEDVSSAMAKAIMSGAEDGTGKLTAGNAAAVRSKDYKKAWMIAVHFSGAGVDDEVGVWASNSLKPGGGILMAVDGFAKEFTVWPDADKTDAGMTIGDDGVDEAMECAS